MTAVGCGGPAASGPNSPPGPTPDGGQVIIHPPDEASTINGKPVSAFYGQFELETTKTYFQGAAAFSDQPNGDNAFLASVFLVHDGSYVFFYQEGSGDVNGSGHSLNLRRDHAFKVTGNWRIEGVALVLGDVARCNGMSIDGKDALLCTLNRAIGYSAAVGKSFRGQRAFSSSQPSDTQWANFQPR